MPSLFNHTAPRGGLSVLLALIVASSVVPAAAAQAPSDSVAMTLDAALARSTGESEEVRLARSQVAYARSQVRAARSAALPQLDGTLAYTRTFASPFSGGGAMELPDSLRFEPDPTAPLEERVRYLEDKVPAAALGTLGALFGNLPFGRPNTYIASIGGSQTLWSGGRVGAALRIANEFQAAAELQLAEQVADIELQTRTAYFNALLAQEMENIANAAVVQAQSFLREEELRRRAGTSSDLDVLRAEVALENLRPQLISARNAAELAKLDLKRLIDVPLTQPIVLTTPLTLPSGEALASPTIDARAMLARRAALEAQERLVTIREQQVRIARGASLPSVGLSFNYGRQLQPARTFGFSGETWRKDFSATIGVQVPIFNGFRRQAEVQQARIELEQERLRLSQLRENLQLQYERALGEKQRAAADLAARQRTVEQAQRVHDLTVLRYQQGLATQLEVTDARLALLQSRTNLAQAISAFYLADAGVARAAGTPAVAPTLRTIPGAAAPAVTPSAVPGVPPTVPPATQSPTTASTSTPSAS